MQMPLACGGTDWLIRLQRRNIDTERAHDGGALPRGRPLLATFTLG
jgi:hypothetical protein